MQGSGLLGGGDQPGLAATRAIAQAFGVAVKEELLAALRQGAAVGVAYGCHRARRAGHFLNVERRGKVQSSQLGRSGMPDCLL